MKTRLMRLLGFALLFLFCAIVSIAQGATIVHYETADASSKRPDFKKAVVAIDFGGTAAMNAKALFMKNGARDFAEGNNPCVVGQTVVCVRIEVGKPEGVSSSGGFSGYGTQSGYTTGGSFGGQLYPVTVSVFLVTYNKDDGGNRPRIMLGQATALAGAGNGSTYSSSYSQRTIQPKKAGDAPRVKFGGGSLYSNGSNDLDASIGNAVAADLDRLLSHNAFKQFLAWGTYAKWLPGADAAVKNAFRQ